MKRRIITTRVSIIRAGELRFFQVKIPFGAISIIGIETAMRIKSGIESASIRAKGISMIGELKLQSNDDSNVFYTTQIQSYWESEAIDKAPKLNFRAYKIWTPRFKRFLEEVIVDANTTVITGYYRDQLGELLRSNVIYDVFLYVWYNYETAIKNDHQPCS